MAIDFNHRFHRIDTDASADLSIIPKVVLTDTISIGNGAYTLPSTDGTTDYVLTTNGAGVVTWEVGGGGGDPAYVSESTPDTLPSATGTDALSMGDSAVASGNQSIAIGFDADGLGHDSIAIGRLAIANTTSGIVIGLNGFSRAAWSIAIGQSSDAKEQRNIAIGLSALTGQTDSGSAEIDAMAIGYNSRAYEEGGISIGQGATTGKSGTSDDPYGIAIGYQASAIHAYSIAFGYTATTTADYQIAIGGDIGHINDVYIGEGVTSATPTSFTLNATGGSGTDIAGANITIAGGKGTGSGTGGTIYFKTATPGSTGSAANALVEAMRIEDDQIATFIQPIKTSYDITASNIFDGFAMDYDNEQAHGWATTAHFSDTPTRAFQLSAEDTNTSDAWIRSYNTSWGSWYKLWHEGNDGAGSGLDADKLDGQEGSYYAIDTHNHDSDYLGITDKASDSELLDNIDSTQFIRSDTQTNATGAISTSSNIESGRGSGGVALTINDGYGNANVTWNHKAGTPEQDGNAARIEVNTDLTSGASFSFELKSNVSSGVPVALTPTLALTETDITFIGNEVWHAGNDGLGSGLDADLLDGQQLSSAAGNNTVVQRAAAGYIYANYFNTSMSASAGVPSHVMVEVGTDGFMRKNTSAQFITNMGIAKLASPALTGNPTAPTQTAGNDSTRLATTAFVQAAGGASGNVVKHAYTSTSAVSTTTTTIPFDDTIPTSSEGKEIMTLAYTPLDTSNILIIETKVHGSHNSVNNNSMYITLFKNSETSALSAAGSIQGGSQRPVQPKLTYKMTAGTTSSITFRVRSGGNVGGTCTFNGATSSRRFGGIFNTYLMITEYKP